MLNRSLLVRRETKEQCGPAAFETTGALLLLRLAGHGDGRRVSRKPWLASKTGWIAFLFRYSSTSERFEREREKEILERSFSAVSKPIFASTHITLILQNFTNREEYAPFYALQDLRTSAAAAGSSPLWSLQWLLRPHCPYLHSQTSWTILQSCRGNFSESGLSVIFRKCHSFRKYSLVVSN